MWTCPRLWVLLFSFLAVRALPAADIDRMSYQVMLSTDGSMKMSITVETSGTALPLFIPCNPDIAVEQLVPLALPAETRASWTTGGNDGIPGIMISGSSDVLKGTVVVVLVGRNPAFWDPERAGPYGTVLCTFDAVNRTPYTIREFSGEVVLPDGFIVQRILDSTPGVKSRDPEPPYRVHKIDNRHAIRISRAEADLGDRLVLKLQLKRSARSWILIGTLLALAVLYLVFFRDGLKPVCVNDDILQEDA